MVRKGLGDMKKILVLILLMLIIVFWFPLCLPDITSKRSA